MERDEADPARPLSAVLRDICDAPGEDITLGEVTHHFGPRAFGALLFVLAIPNLLPLPPGSTTVLGA
ncbi:MAG TPA: exopolysaccharide biosynthesis protein, partial [Caulobacteraceae bacterium]|nr:exopolysaccharide biosynthesis protein [Caulobacteraceae bacterium]